MTMTKNKKAEIVREYKTAKNKSSQIGILADLNCCTRKDIEKVLIEAGIELRKKKIAPVQPKEKEEPKEDEESVSYMNIEPVEEEIEEIKAEEDYLPVVVWDALTIRIQQLDKDIKNLTREKEEIEEFIFNHS